MSNNTVDMVNHPGPDCPDWCVMGIDGLCVGEYEGPPPDAPQTPGHYVYARKRMQPDGTVDVEVAIHENGGRQIHALNSRPDEITIDHAPAGGTAE